MIWIFILLGAGDPSHRVEAILEGVHGPLKLRLREQFEAQHTQVDIAIRQC